MKKYLNKLHYRSWHRGTKEADLFLGNFFDNNQDKIIKINPVHYETFLNAINDGEIMHIIKGKYTWPENISIEIINLLEDYIKSAGFRE